VYRDIPDDLRELIEPVVADHGCELVDVDDVRGSGPGVLRVTIDRSEGDGQVPVDGCAEISREIESQLDAADVMPGRYRLEVSSPGLDRVLAREKDFLAACGMEVRIETRRLLAERRRFRGTLIDFKEGIVRLLVDGTEVEIPFDEIVKANSLYQFSRADFSSGGRSGGAAK